MTVYATRILLTPPSNILQKGSFKSVKLQNYCLNCISFTYFSRDMRFPTMWYVRPAKPQTSLRIRAVWSEPLPVAWIFYESLATDRTSFGVSKLEKRLHRLVWVYTCQNTTLLEITCHSSFHDSSYQIAWSVNFCVTTWREDCSLKSEKLSTLLFMIWKQQRSLSFCILRVDPENPFVSVDECFKKPKSWFSTHNTYGRLM